MNSLLRARKGTTLVEILVVMVILLVGIMTVVVMFPSGFRVVRAAESQTIATKLAQAEVERWKNMPGNLPDAILPLDFSATGLSNTILNGQDPGPGFDGMMPTGTAGRFYPGNSGNFRMVENETTPIPVGSFFQTGGGAIYGSRYNLAFSPVELQPDPSNAGQYLGISVKSGDLRRRVGDHDDRIYLRRGQYGVDYTLGTSNGKPCFYACFSYDRNPTHEYRISYSYTVSKSSGSTGGEDIKYLTEIDQLVNPSANGDWVPVEINVPADYDIEQVDDGTDSCARGFAQVVTWSDDPYEFTVADSILGIIAFNPRAKNALETTVKGVRAVAARISYRIYDTRIIREQKVASTPNEDMDGNGTNDHIQIKLALRHVLDSGDPDDVTDGDATDNPGEQTFEGLVYQHLGMEITNDSQILVKQPLLVIDLATGLRVELPAPGQYGLDIRHYPIDFEAGIVHLPETANLIDWNSQPLPDTANVPLAGRHLRFFYRADGDWSVQCQKAYSYFLRDYDTQIDYRRYRLVQDTDGWKLAFARCMSGQSVAVDYTYTDAGGTIHKVSGKNLRISDDTITVGGAQCAYVSLGPTGTVINPSDRIIVVGTSFRSRVIWRDGKVWRHVDIDTNLTRNSN